jgi:hypothetical protein
MSYFLSHTYIILRLGLLLEYLIYFYLEICTLLSLLIFHTHTIMELIWYGSYLFLSKENFVGKPWAVPCILQMVPYVNSLVFIIVLDLVGTLSEAHIIGS